MRGSPVLLPIDVRSSVGIDRGVKSRLPRVTWCAAVSIRWRVREPMNANQRVVPNRFNALVCQPMAGDHTDVRRASCRAGVGRSGSRYGRVAPALWLERWMELEASRVLQLSEYGAASAVRIEA